MNNEQISSRYIFQINSIQVLIFELNFEFCNSCQATHAFSEFGMGTRVIPVSDWDYDILYEELGN